MIVQKKIAMKLNIALKMRRMEKNLEACKNRELKLFFKREQKYKESI